MQRALLVPKAPDAAHGACKGFLVIADSQVIAPLRGFRHGLAVSSIVAPKVPNPAILTREYCPGMVAKTLNAPWSALP